VGMGDGEWEVEPAEGACVKASQKRRLPPGQWMLRGLTR